MVPTLQPGDWLLVDPGAFRLQPPTAGDLVVVPDPRLPRRLLVKRVAAGSDHRSILLEGDAPAGSTDWRAFGPVEAGRIEGRPWFRYWPLRRLGRVR